MRDFDRGWWVGFGAGVSLACLLHQLALLALQILWR